jgi:RHS repeat-associated protein
MLVSDGTSGYVHLGRQPNETITGTDVSFDLTDALGSVRAVTDASGAVIGAASYDVFGATRDATGTLGTFGFTGEQEDPTGLLFLRARYYNPQVGRFLSADALQPNAFGTGGWNQYGYVAGNPTTSVDPTGFGPLVEYSLRASVTSAAVSAGFGFVISMFTCSSDGTFGEYAGCVFRGTLAAGVFGFLAGGWVNAPLWFMYGSTFVAGTVSSGVHQILGGEFSLTDALLSGVIAAATFGAAKGVGWIWRRFKPASFDTFANTLRRFFRGEATNTAGSGPVTFRPPPGATAEEIAQVQAYVEGCNAALCAGELSPTGRVSTSGALRADASSAAAAERARAAAAGSPYSGHVGHVPDTTWTGSATPPSWMDLTPRVNMSLGGQAVHYPIGYRPTVFEFLDGLG